MAPGAAAASEAAGSSQPVQPDAGKPGPDIEQWLARLRTERGHAPLTITAYRRDLARLVQLATPPSGAAIDWSGIDDTQVRRWVARLARDGLGPRSIARILSAWRGFFDALSDSQGLVANPVRPVRAPKRPRHLPKALPVDEAIRLVEPRRDAHASRFESIRDQAMVELFYSSGLRLSELTSLDARHTQPAGIARSRSWFDASASEVTVLGKGGKTRSVPVGRAAMTALARWTEVRTAWLEQNPGCKQLALFLTRRGTRLSNRSVQLRLKALALRRDMSSKVHPHVLRHSFASHMLQSSGDLRAVQELLGHANIATTQIYTALDFQRLATVYDAAHPRARRRSE